MHVRSFLSSSKTIAGITIKGGDTSSGKLTEVSLSDVRKLGNTPTFIVYFRDGKMMFDFSEERSYVNNLSVSTSNAVYLDDVSSVAGDGKTDDTEALRSVLKKASGLVIGNKNKTYLVNTTSPMNAKGIGIVNMNFKSTEPTRLLNIRGGDNNFLIHNCTFDGGRGDFTETWNYFSSYYGKDSCQPAITNYIQAVGNTGRIVIRKSTFKNIFAKKVLSIGSKGSGVVFYKDLTFKNVASRTFHGWNDKSTQSGVQYALDISADGAGILPSTFKYKNKSGSTVTMKRSSSSCPFPQNSFGNIVSYGTFIADNIKADDMASCGVGFDHNRLALANEISISCNDSRLKTNNPYGAFWNEYSQILYARDVTVVIEDRGDDIGDTSLLALAGNKAAICEMRNVKVSTDIAINKLVRLSSKGLMGWGLSKVKAIDNSGSTSTKGVSHGYLSSATSKDQYLHLTRGSTVEAYKVRFQPINDLLIQETTFRLDSGFSPLSYDSGVSGISKTQKRVRVQKNTISGNSTFNLPMNTFEFSGNDVSGSLVVNCDIDTGTIKNNDIDGKTSINKSRISDLSTS